MSKFFSLAALVVVGWIVADILAHPTGARMSFDALNNLTATSGNLVAGNFPSSY